MILRKPYAFLIRKFRLIHFIIFGMLLYIFTKSIAVYSFYNDYAVKHYFTPIANLAKNYINSYIFIVIVLIFIFSAIVFYLLSIKKKSRKLYFFICFYYIIMFIFFLYVNNIFIDLEDSALSTEMVRVIRDISLLVLIPQLLFMIMVASRALGFNVKQFEFQKDLEDLKIDAEDYEEVEVTLGKNNYKYARTFRRTLRYLKYFLLENKFYLSILASIVIVGLALYFFIDIKVTNIVYYENQEIYVNTLWYTVENSYYTSRNINGIEINKDKYYILVKTKIENKTNNKYDLSRSLFKLEVKNELLSPVFTLNQEFIDLGNIYAPMQISKESIKEVIVVFEINKEDLNQEYKFKVKANENIVISDKDAQYKDIVIKPVSIDSNGEENNYEIPCTIEFNESNLGESTLYIENYSIDSTFKENYDYCLSDNCYLKTVIIEPKKGNALLKLNADLVMDDTVYMKKYIKSVSDLILYYGKIKYNYAGKTYESKLEKSSNKYISGTYTYLEVPSRILNSTKIELYLNIREKTYIIVLK